MNMSETEKDHGIILFGQKILLPKCRIPANSEPMDACSSTKKTEMELLCAEKPEQEDNSDDSMEQKENEAMVNSRPADDKILKKPDKIVQCPRCNSMDTKFCYFNNYNVNQPRHFCKKCQRYWTAGGTMRNVPIGAGKRKSKHLASRLETPRSVSHNHTSKDNETVLKFGPDTPLSESMLNVKDQKTSADANSQPSLSRSSVTNTDSRGYGLSEHSPSNWLQCYPASPWVLPMNPVWNNVALTGAAHPNSASMQWCPTPMFAVPGIRPQNVPLQLVSASHWSGPPLCLSPPSSTSNSCCTGNGSPTLGQHTRDTVLADEDKSEKRVPVRKTIRIDVTEDASESPSNGPMKKAKTV